MNLAEGLSIGCSDDVGNVLLLASCLTLNDRRHIHLIKDDKVLPALAIRMYRFVLSMGWPAPV
jgi:hypothetical protein